MSSLPTTPAHPESKPSSAPPRRMHAIEKKRRIVEETFRPHTSVARVAQAHGVNANQVFYWRKQYQQGLLGSTRPKAALLPVQIADPVPLEPTSTAVEKHEVLMAAPPRAEAGPTGTIHLELAKAKLCIDGVADLACLRTILDCLLG